MDQLSFLPNSWLHRVSTRLQAQWPTADPQQLDDVALDLWRDDRLRAMPPEEAAVAWLRPVLTQQFANGLRDAHQFEFGSSRGSAEKTELLARASAVK
jgi:hypothetical protein